MQESFGEANENGEEDELAALAAEHERLPLERVDGDELAAVVAELSVFLCRWARCWASVDALLCGVLLCVGGRAAGRRWARCCAVRCCASVGALRGVGGRADGRRWARCFWVTAGRAAASADGAAGASGDERFLPWALPWALSAGCSA